MITDRSRYRSYSVVLLRAVDGTPRPTLVPPLEKETIVNFTSYIWKQNDRVDLLAYQLLGDDAAWWQIADANPEILVWSEIPYGTVIRIPNA